MIFTKKNKETIRQVFAEENAKLLAEIRQDLQTHAEDTRQMFQQELAAAFQRDLIMEMKPRKPGDPEKVIKERRVNIIDEITRYLPFVEGAIRGMQTDVGRQRDHVIGLTQAVRSFERPLVAIARERCLDLPAGAGVSARTLLIDEDSEDEEKKHAS